MKPNKLLSITIVVVLSFTLFSHMAMASQTLDDPEPECNPRAARLAEWMGEDCAVLMEYQAQGVGLGVIMQAYAQSQVYRELDWEELVARQMSEEGSGWGELKQALRLAFLFALNVDDLLARRAEGTGWGEIKQEYREGPGKPPWAADPKQDNAKPEKPDKPKNPDDSEEPDQAEQGPPDWARPGKPPKAKP